MKSSTAITVLMVVFLSTISIDVYFNHSPAPTKPIPPFPVYTITVERLCKTDGKWELEDHPTCYAKHGKYLQITKANGRLHSYIEEDYGGGKKR
jgi:hypothetical protein